jgi:hypothetical protein
MKKIIDERFADECPLYKKYGIHIYMNTGFRERYKASTQYIKFAKSPFKDISPIGYPMPNN